MSPFPLGRTGPKPSCEKPPSAVGKRVKYICELKKIGPNNHETVLQAVGVVEEIPWPGIIKAQASPNKLVIRFNIKPDFKSFVMNLHLKTKNII